MELIFEDRDNSADATMAINEADERIVEALNQAQAAAKIASKGVDTYLTKLKELHRKVNALQATKGMNQAAVDKMITMADDLADDIDYLTADFEEAMKAAIRETA